MKVILVLILLLSVFYQTNSSNGLNGISTLLNSHPRLIITGENIDEFRAKAKDENQQLFKQAKELAQEFSQRPVIHFQNANNSYREIGDAMPVLGLMYQINGDKKYVETAERWISAMLHTESWEGSQNLGRSSWMVGLCFLYDWMNDALNENLKAQLLNRLVDEAEIVIETASDTRALSNHLLIETSAVGMVGLVLPEGHGKKQYFLETADKWASYIIDHAPLDGSWGEGVQYWQYGTGYFLRFLEAAKTAGYKNYFDNYDWLKKTGYFPIYFSLPGNLTKVINFSDCGTDRYLPAFLFYLPAKIYGNPYFQDFGKKVQLKTPHKFSWLDFLFYDASVPAKDFTTLPNFKHFTDQGFVSMRSGWEKNSTVVGFRCGPAPGHRNQMDPQRIEHRGFGPGHQQPDINSFVIFSQNEWLAIDPGYTHLKETKNFNTILVNGYGQAGAGGQWLDYMEFESRTPVPKIIYTENTDDYDYIIGDAGNIYVDEAHLNYFRRHLIFLKPDVIVIIDDLKSIGNATYEWLLQLNEITNVSKMDNQFRLNKNNVEFWVSPVLPGNVTLNVKKRELDANDVYGLPNHRSGILKTLNLSTQGEALRYLVVISIQNKENKQAPIIHFENNILSVEINGKKRVLKYNPAQLPADQPLMQIME